MKKDTKVEGLEFEKEIILKEDLESDGVLNKEDGLGYIIEDGKLPKWSYERINGNFDTNELLTLIESITGIDIDSSDAISVDSYTNITSLTATGDSTIDMDINENLSITIKQVYNDSDPVTTEEIAIKYRGSVDIDTLKDSVISLLLIDKKEDVVSGETNEISDSSNLSKSKFFYISLDKANQYTLTPIIVGDVIDDSKKVNKMIKSLDNSNKIVNVISGSNVNKVKSKLISVINGVSKDVIFIPVNMIENTLNNLDFIELIYAHPDKIFVIENCDKFFDKSHVGNIFVNNVVQLIDSVITNDFRFNLLLTTSDYTKLDEDIMVYNDKLIDMNSNQLKHL